MYVLRTRGAPPRFYTGRAGEAWLSTDHRFAFRFTTYREAEDRCRLFNARTPVTGAYFAVVGAEHLEA